MAVSEKFGLLFLAYTGGFLVARTTDVVRLAKAIRDIEEGNGDKKETEGMCIQEKSIMDARIGDVHILALSTDSSVLAVAIGGEVRFFSVPKLINKDQEPIFTRSVGESGHVKIFLWRKSVENSFIVLSTSGSLYHGNSENHLKDIMDGVDAADWSVEGNFLAVARNNVLSILSSEFRQQLNMSLLFQSWTSDTDFKSIIKVDSLKWVRNDCIIIGCVQINESDEEVDYMVQVITAEWAAIPEACSKPVVVSFRDLFHGIVDDIVPSGGGPHLFMSYLENWDVGIVANRKNTDEHVVLLAWPENDDGKSPVALEFEQDKFIPRIELQENLDENLLLCIDVDRNCIHEKLELKIDSEVKVLSPHCILLCLSCEGKLIMFHVARISEPVSSCTSFKPPDGTTDVKENTSVVLPLAEGSTLPTTVVKGKELQSLEGFQSSGVMELHSVHSARSEKTEQNLEILHLPFQSPFKQGISSGIGSSMKPGSQLYSFTFSGVGESTLSSVGNMLSGSTISQASKLSSKSEEAGPVATHVDSLQIASFGLQSARKHEASYGNTVKSSLLSSGVSVPSDSQETLGIQRHNINQSFTTTIQPNVRFSKESAVLITSSDESKAPFWSGHNESVPASSPASLKENSIPGKHLAPKLQDVHSGNRVRGPPGLQESEPKLSKQFYSVNDMAKELDTLLAYLEQEGGFRDACTIAHRSLVLSLEDGIRSLSERFRICKAKMAEQLRQIQQLQDKRMHLSSRHIYMKGLVAQASNGQYWDIWNRQKLGPEFEVKQQHISKLNHDLVNELLELERHFNALELKKYGEGGATPKGQRALLDCLESSSQVCSLHSLYSTVNSQLAAAEQLSECLSKQMSVLNINSPPSKRQSITKELLESIGLEYDSDSFQSPDPKKTGYSLDSSKMNVSLSSSSRAVKEQTRRNAVSTLKTSQPESSRRRRDSLDRSWTRFDPPKTTVKRMLREEHFKASAEKFLSSEKEAAMVPALRGRIASQMPQEALSSRSLQSSMSMFQSQLDRFNEDDQNKLSQQSSEYQKNSLFKWTSDLSQVSKDIGPIFSLATDMQSNMQPTQMVMSSSLPRSVVNRKQELVGLADKPRHGQLFIARQPASSAEDDSVGKARFASQFDALVCNQSFVEASGSASHSKFTSSIKALQSSETLNMKRGEDGLMRSSKGITEQEVTPERPFSILEKSHSSLSSSTNGNVSNVQKVANIRQSCGTLSSTGSSTTTLPPASEHSSAAASRVLLTTSSESPAASSNKHFGEPSIITLSHVSSSQTSLRSISSAAPVDPLHSSPASFKPQISKTSAAQSLPLGHVNSSSPFMTSQLSTIVVKPATELANVVSKSQPTVLPNSEASTALSADKKSSLLSSAVSLGSASSLSLSQIPSATSNLPSAPTKEKDESLDIVTEEDEMDEEAPETNTVLNLGALGGFGLGQTSAPSAPKTNPFSSLISSPASPASAAFSLTTPTGELFRPASFSLPSSQPVQSSQPMNPGGFSGGGFSGFGQPAQIGGQQALGSVLGAFGQSRQLGIGAQASGLPSPGGFGGGGFSTAAMNGGSGFAATAVTGGGFSGVGSGSGGFAGIAGGGFAAMASKSGGFAAAASGGSGLGASPGGGFTSGGFGSFATKQGAGVFSQFGGTAMTGAGKPPAELLMQMRK